MKASGFYNKTLQHPFETSPHFFMENNSSNYSPSSFFNILNNPIVHFDLRCIGWCRRGKNVKWFDKCGCFACLLGQETWPAQTEFFCQPRRSHALFLPFWPAAVYMWLQALLLCVSELWRPTFFFTSLAPTTDQEHLPYFFHYPLGIAGRTRVY
jgi:hypothetical protein